MVPLFIQGDTKHNERSGKLSATVAAVGVVADAIAALRGTSNITSVKSALTMCVRDEPCESRQRCSKTRARPSGRLATETDTMCLSKYPVNQR